MFPSCLADEKQAVSDDAVQVACNMVVQLLDCPEPLAAFLLALLAYLQQHDDNSQHAQKQQTMQQRHQQQTAATEANSSASVKQQVGLNQDMLHCVLRALHCLGRSWHYLSPHHQGELAGALCRLLRQGLPRGAGPEGSGGILSSSQALLQLEPEMLWWHRLAAVSGSAALLASQAHSSGLLAGLAACIPLWQQRQARALQDCAGVSAPCGSASIDTGARPLHQSHLGSSLDWLLFVHLCAYTFGLYMLHTPLLHNEGQPELAALVQCLMDVAASGVVDINDSQGNKLAAQVAHTALALARTHNADVLHAL